LNVLKNCKSGIMLYNTNDVYVGKSLNEYGEFSQAEVDLFEKFISDGMTVIDVGANIGCHTVNFARMVGSTGLVFAYEPQRLCYYCLCANVALNNLTNVYCLQNAVGREDGRIDVPELDYRCENNFGGISLGTITENCDKCSVKMIRLDDRKLNRIDFIKIDVEGMEGEVLSGAKETILKHRPFLYLENDRPENVSLLVKMVRSLNYEIYFHAPPLYNSGNFLKNRKNIFGTITSINMFCCPKEFEMSIDTAALKLTRLNADGKISLHRENNNINQLHVDVNEAVIESCIKASVYYSENLCDHTRGLAFADMAMRVNSEDYRGYYQAAMVMCKSFNYETALKFIDLSIEKNPRHFNSLMNRATILGGLNRYPEAIDQYKIALKEQPDAANTHFYMACALMSEGRFKEGFDEYEWRFKMDKIKQFVNLMPNVPMWNGENLDGKKILIFCEQGGGDLINFIRYAKFLSGEVHLACPRNMIKLIKNCDGLDNIIPFNSDDGTIVENNFDYMCSVMSLPRFFGINTEAGYIKTETKDWKCPCEFENNFLNVGVVWAGNEMHENDQSRSCRLKHLEKLSKVPNVRLYSLQKGEMRRHWRSEGAVDLLEGSENVDLEDYTFYLNDFNDTANFIEKLDLVISVDTCVAHIAAAMGKSVWLMTGFYPDHRWMNKTDKSIWYPTVKIFRKEQDNGFFSDSETGWAKCFESASKELEKLSSEKKR
jgi:FkbM family methyltransferase